MKMRILATTLLAALASSAAVAASEGGDTWSAVGPVAQSNTSVLQSALSADAVAPALGAAFEGSEGGDTWSSVQALHDTTVRQATTEDRADRTDATTVVVHTGGSEGGDTWSRFVPQFEGQSMTTAGLASKPAL